MKKTQAKQIDPCPVMLEMLEDRIAPATVATSTGLDATAFHAVAAGSSILLKAGQGLASDNGGGVYYLYVQKGEALVFTTDLNADNKVESNEITGISAGDGLKLLSFVNINGDIVTNLTAQGALTDSDGNATNGLDGKIVLNSHIDSITLRSLTDSDLPQTPYNIAHGNNVFNRLAESDYSIFGNIYAGGGIGSSTDRGLSIDTTGFSTQGDKYLARFGIAGVASTPSVGFIFTGSAVSGQYFSFGTSPDFGNGPSESLRGQLAKFTAAAGQSGGDVNGVEAGLGTTTIDPITGVSTTVFTPVDYRIAGIYTGTGGFGAKGGDISNVTLSGDTEGFYAIAGNGGDGVTGGNGGGILNFTVASTTIENNVVLQTGDGGYGFLGAAGAAGLVSINGDVDLYGNIKIGLGKGGDGLGTAGTGTSLESANFTLPSIGLLTPVQLVSTYRVAGDLDRPLPVDFNGDGFTDGVFLSNNPQQLVVVFGDGQGGWSDTIAPVYLDASTYATTDNFSSAVQVGDFNGDGKLDIVTASSTGTDFTGLKTFINNGDGTFQNARYSPLWASGSVAVTNLAVGDFDHDGTTDVAMLYVGQSGLRFSEVAIMSGIMGPDHLHSDGYFAVNFDKGSGTEKNAFPVAGVGKGSPQIMKATAMVKGDVLTDSLLVLDLAASKGGLTVYQMKNSDLISNSITGSTGITFSTRTLDSANNIVYQAAAPITAHDFSIIDVSPDGMSGDGIFDVGVVGMSGDGVMAILQGTADGDISQPDERGIQLTSTNVLIPSVLHGDIKLTSILGSVKSNFSAPGVDNEFSVDSLRAVASDDFNATSNTIYVFDVTGFMITPDPANLNPNPPDVIQPVTSPASTGGYSAVGSTLGESIFDAYYNNDLSTTNTFAGASSAKLPPDGHEAWAIIIGDGKGLHRAIEIATNSLLLQAGAGGNSLLGHGGSGGSIGTGATIDKTTGAITASIDISKYHGATLVTGSGGSGFLGGGDSGNLNGILNTGTTINYATGSGGSAFLGNGGSGGSIMQLFLTGISTLSLHSKVTLSTGDGGFGLQGGSGGSIVGRGAADTPDAIFDTFDLSTGSGGNGITAGGNGGGMTNFLGQYGDAGFGGGPVYNLKYASYTTGSGGSAVAGVGGKGGGLTSLSPSPRYDASDGPIFLQTGSGGDGLTGGAGGAILNFINSPSAQFNAEYFYLTTGNGGRGVTGVGGAGGAVQNVSVAAEGTLFSEIFGITSTINAIIAGNGGLSSAGSGGAGGSLSTVTTTAEAGAALAAAGQGGDGLVAGGVGGNLSTVALDSGALADARVVGMAGKGGDAYGVTAAKIALENTATAIFQPLVAMGLVNGTGGNGGSISGFIQSVHVQTSTDLIAGNGGSTINYGRISDLIAGVGKGGSISHVALAGDSGIMKSDVDIKDYSSTFVSDIVSDIHGIDVTSSFQLNIPIPSISASDGNVGVLVGNKGFIRNGDPVTGGTTGSVIDFTARNIMSMVAGSVENIASIASISGINLPSGAVVGAFKDGINGSPVTHVNGNAYYSNAHYTGSVISSAHGGGSLVDGAILAANYSGPLSGRVFGS